MKSNSLQQLGHLGQSVWLDEISREMIQEGELKRLIREDGLSGITTNPKTVADAISGSDRYDQSIAQQASLGRDAAHIYTALMVEDVIAAADVLRPVFDETEGDDGYVSIEVSPQLAYDTNATVTEGITLLQSVDRPNVFIKVPATREGLPAITELTALGCNVNVTLLFGLDRYREVRQAYWEGLARRLSARQPIDKVRSVASFFLSRIDTLVDTKLEAIAQEDQRRERLARPLRGRAAIALARVAFQHYKQSLHDATFQRLQSAGAHAQKLLWASTGTKNPDYSDVLYVEALIGKDTITTLPRKTMDAYRDHGQPEPRLENDVAEAESTVVELTELGIDLREVRRTLEREGVDKFNQPFEEALRMLKERSLATLRAR